MRSCLEVALRARRVLVWPLASWNMGKGAAIFQTPTVEAGSVGEKGRNNSERSLFPKTRYIYIYSTSHYDMTVFKGYKDKWFHINSYMFM